MTITIKLPPAMLAGLEAEVQASGRDVDSFVQDAIQAKLTEAEIARPNSNGSFIQRAQQLDKRGHTDAALDLLYDSVDELMRRREFGHLDSLLACLEPSEFSVDILLGLLTATLPAKSRIPARGMFFKKSEETLTARGENDAGLLTGLEG